MAEVPLLTMPSEREYPLSRSLGRGPNFNVRALLPYVLLDVGLRIVTMLIPVRL